MATLNAIVATILLLVYAMSAMAQPSLLDMMTDDEEALPLWDAVEHFRQQPLCLRAATAHDLTMIPGVSRPLAARILRVAQLQPSWGPGRIADSLCLALPQRLMLMLCVTTVCDTTQWSLSALARTATIRDAAGRLSFRYGSWHIDAVASRVERDIATVGHIGATARAYLGETDVLLGDVRPRIGTGLIMGAAGMAYGGAAAPPDDPFTVRAWTSRQRRGFLRGGAVYRRDTVGSHMLHLLVAAGLRKLTTRLDSARHVVSIDDAASLLEVPPAGRAGVQESVLGAAIAMADTSWYVGTTAWSIRYDHPLRTAASNDIVGTGGMAWSVFAGISGNNVGIAWEAAVDTRGRTAVVAQASRQSNSSRLGVALRWIGAGYRAPFGNAPTTSAAVANEMGLTISGALRLRPQTRLDVMLDMRRTPDRTYFVPRPVRGIAADVIARERLLRQGTVWLRGRIDDVDDAAHTEGVARTLTTRRTRLRLVAGIDWQLTLPLTVSCRWNAHHARWSAYHDPMTGNALTVRCRYRPWPWLHLMMQQSMFDTPGIDAAAYVAESAMPGMLRTPVLVGRGIRSLLGIRLQILPAMSVWAAAISAERERRIDVMMQWRFDGIVASATDQEFVGGDLTDEGLGDGQ